MLGKKYEVVKSYGKSKKDLRKLEYASKNVKTELSKKCKVADIAKTAEQQIRKCYLERIAESSPNSSTSTESSSVSTSTESQ